MFVWLVGADDREPSASSVKVPHEPEVVTGDKVVALGKLAAIEQEVLARIEWPAGPRQKMVDVTRRPVAETGLRTTRNRHPGRATPVTLLQFTVRTWTVEPELGEWIIWPLPMYMPT